MAEATIAHSHNHDHPSSPTFHDAHFIDVHLESKLSRPFRLDRHHSLRTLNWRQHRYEQLYAEQLWHSPDPVKNTKGTRGEVWHEARVKQTLAVRPVWMRTCHCVDCVRFRFLEKDKGKRAEIALAIKRIKRSGGCDCWDSLCTGCSWDVPPVTEEDGTEGGECHSEGVEACDSCRAIPFEVHILDLVRLPRRRRARRLLDLISSERMPHVEGSAVESDAKSALEGWVSVHEDMSIDGSSVDWDRCSVASL